MRLVFPVKLKFMDCKMKPSGNQQFSLTFLLLSLLFTGLISCNVLKPIVVEIDPEQAAVEAYQAGDYETALSEYEALIAGQRSRQEEVKGSYFRYAGLSAFVLGQTSVALDYLERARHTDAVDDTVYAALARLYRQIDNLSREITHLENYLSDYPEGPEADEFRVRYFETLVESRNWEDAYALWPQIDAEDKDHEGMVQMFYQVNKALGHEEKADSLAEQLLEFNPNHFEALDRLAKKYYNLAEARYRQEMDAYNRNRTNRQYALLLEAFEVLNRDYRRSLAYFLRLYESNPGKEYASYLHNIYVRFQDDERARYYRQQLGQ